MGGAPSLILPGGRNGAGAYWQGGENTYRDDLPFFTREGIGAIVSICNTSAHASLQVDNLFIHKPDIPSTTLYTDFKDIILFIHKARCSGKKVYTHCACGISRATTATCAYLMSHLGLSFDEALLNVHRARPIVCPNDGFRHQLRRWEMSGDAAAMGATLRKQFGDALVVADMEHFLQAWDEAPSGKATRRSFEFVADGTGPTADPAEQKAALRKYLEQYRAQGMTANSSVGLEWLENGQN